MAAPRVFKPADFGYEPEGVTNAAGNPLYKKVVLEWSKPKRWMKAEGPPSIDCDECVYALIHNHGNMHSKNSIVYVGLTTSPDARFYNHPTAKRIVAKRGTVGLSFAPIEIVGRNRVKRIAAALNEIEHLLIWALPNEPLENERKWFTLPGMGTNGGNAWHIRNAGYRFSGRMPREILYPWMLTKPGRNRSVRHK